ncbi:aldo/keto reductase [Polynucleobacter asymbioticus]|jgi:aryl-alcohol dehydrogenase-like predicted oxidoreductase|uniref:Aldo/keto reductase n=1 Tax=Polynucleobacter asymbioticus TaxID=576611 RepID=A0AAC9IVH0_9BURK|nr:aldo/keto reductase [Polynucleobacter asymbioticus]APB99544.1 aldo/keto reductase [Polynucleobacter asymbioticus]APC01851.1 aldo/keto reductase [Polynucleobacter asymbioticus]
MKYRLLGNTGLYVSELCLGTMTFGAQGFWEVMGGLQQSAVNELVKTSFDSGINFFDTANVYSMGQSEVLLGQAIKECGLPRDQLVIATKSTGIMDETPNGRGQSRFHIFNEVDASLKRLQLDHIDLYQVHGFDPLTPFEESLSALNDLVRKGKIRYIGLCNMAAWQVMKAIGISRQKGYAEFASVQSYYSIAGRDLEREIFPLVQDQQLGLMVWSPLAGGYLSGKFNRDTTNPDGARRSNFDFPPINKDKAFACIDTMTPIANAHGVSVAQVALAWILSKKPVSSIIIGARKLDQLKDNIAASKLTLTECELKSLDDVSALSPEYPGWMLALQGQYRATPPFKD